jgi:hypothetical protein
MEREVVEIGVKGFDVKCLPDSRAEKWQIQI